MVGSSTKHEGVLDGFEDGGDVSSRATMIQFSNDDKHAKHVKGAQIMLETFKKNSGLYIKLGQLIATVPDCNFSWTFSLRTSM